MTSPVPSVCAAQKTPSQHGRNSHPAAATSATIDLGVITASSETARDEHYFCCVGGVGLDAEVARRANQLPRWLRAHGGYALSLLPTMFQFAPVSMKISMRREAPHQAKPTVLAAFANTPTYGGGMKIAPHAKLDDGQLDLCIVRDIDPFKLFCLFPTIYFGSICRCGKWNIFKPRLRIETEQPSMSTPTANTCVRRRLRSHPPGTARHCSPVTDKFLVSGF